MAKAWEQYTKEMAKSFGYLATWTPGVTLALGDVGVLRKNLFTRISSLQNLGIAFQTREDQTREDQKYASSGSLSVVFKAAGQVPTAGSALTEAEAGVTIEFTRKKAVVYEALGCTSPSIDDQAKLGSEIIKRYKTGGWNKDWVVITELVMAESGTVLISEEKGAKIEISAKGTVAGAAFSLAEASVALAIVSQRDMQTTLVAKDGLTPLFRARGVKSQDSIPAFLAAHSVGAADLAVPRDAEAARMLYFGNMPFDFRAFDEEE